MSTPQTDHQATITPETTKTAVSLGRIVLFGVGSALISLVILAWYNGAWQLWATSGVVFVTALAAAASIILIRRGRPQLAVLILIGSTEAAFLLGNILISGLSWVLAILLPAVSTTVCYLLLPPQSRKWINISAVLVSIMLLATDFASLSFRLNLPANLQGTMQIVFGITLIILLAYMTQIIRTVRARLVVAFLVVALTPLGILAIINTRTLESRLKDNANEQLRVIAFQTAANLDVFIQTNLDILRTEAQLPELADFLTLSPAENIDARREVETILTALSRRDQVNILSYALLDLHGINVIDSFPANAGSDISNQEYFQQTLRTGLPTISGVYYKENSFYFSVPVRDSAHKAVGVLRIQYNASILQQIITQSTDLSGAGSFAMLLDENHIFLANGKQPELIFKSLIPLEATKLATLQSIGQLPNGTADEFSAGLPALEDALQSGEKLISIDSHGSETTPDAVAIASMTTHPWLVIYSIEQSILLKPVQDQTLATVLFAFLISLVAAISALILSQTLVSPLVKLTDVAREVTQGNIQAYATATSNDEFGILANAFNTMTARLRDLIVGLEQRVAERTTDLELARQQSDKRARELQTIGEISSIINSEQKLESLLPLITRLVSERFDFYHTGIFLLNETNQFAVLQAANSEGGKNMLARGHKLEVGGSGIVGYVAKFGTARISLDVGLDAAFFNNPDLPNTRSEMALPLKVRDKIVGALDVQSEKPGAFTENDANILSILADQIAIALENARLFTQTQQALSEAQALYRQNSQEGWLTFSREEASIGYHQSITGGKKLTAPVETNEIRQAMNRGSVLVFNKGAGAQEASIVVPIKLRGQIIGALNIKAPTQDRRWSKDEINLAEAISERLSLALENARLIQDSQRQVIKEQTISEVTGKIGASINLKNVLQTAVEELGRAMPGSEVVLQLQKEIKDENKK